MQRFYNNNSAALIVDIGALDVEIQIDNAADYQPFNQGDWCYLTLDSVGRIEII